MASINIQIEQLNFIGHWEYPCTKISDNKCNICNKHIMFSPNFTNNDKYNTNITVGKCKHSFHTNCINTADTCPTCLTNWSSEKVLDNNTFYRQLNE
jgi:hypothetical protein